MESDRKVFSLLEVCKSIQKTLTSRYSSPFWVKAEMHKLNYYQGSGHCFPDLLQKEADEVVAQMRATLWKEDYIRVSSNFLQIVKEPLREGLELLLLAYIQYDPKYGLSLRIIEIDPSYTLGQMQKERALCEQRLKEEGLWTLQQKLPFPLLPKRIAILSAVSSKGYADFIQIIEQDLQRNYFLSALFPVILQGELAVESIPSALKRIAQYAHCFDVVVILRGGGSDVGISSFNRYEIASAVARCPLPVLTGIGHSTNSTLSEEVAYFSGITPTQVGHFLWACMEEYRGKLQEDALQIKKITENILIKNRRVLESVNSVCRFSLQGIKSKRKEIENAQQQWEKGVRKFCFYQASQLREWEKWCKASCPERWLKMGYSLTFLKGKIIKEASHLSKGHQVEIHFGKGKALASIIDVKE